MILYLFKRLGLSAVVIALVVLVSFALLHLIPGDPATIALGPRAGAETIARFTEKMHLDEPIWRQFLIFAGNVVTGDMGEDVFSNRPVAQIIGENIGFTLALGAAGLGWAILVGIPLGCLAALRPNSALDRVTGILSVGTIAVPSFVIAIWSLLLFAVTLRWLPAIGAGEPGNLPDQLAHLILPAFALGLGWVGYLSRMVRASLLEVMNEDYIRAANAFGLRPRRVIFGYALRVAILPTITLIGLGFGGLISSTVFAEVIFARPGLGKLLYRMLSNRAYIGEAVHKGDSYPGEHDAIIDRETWDRVHAILQESPRKRAARTRADTPALLKGLLFGPDGAAFSPTHTRKGGRLYRYYVSQTVLKHGAGACSIGRVPAGEIEAAVVDQLRAVFRQPEIVAGTWKAARAEDGEITETDAREALTRLDPLWDELFPAEQARIVGLLVERVEIGTEGLNVRLRMDGLATLAREITTDIGAAA